jgi:hypothetical protein
MPSMYDLSVTSRSGDIGTKPHFFYECYDKFFARRNFVPKTILEVGVHMGESTKLFSRAFPDAKIVGIDIKRNEIDFSKYPNITYLQADQSDPVAMKKIVKDHFKSNPLDFIIDDASHIGILSKKTFDITFPLLRAGGVYVVEDWGTGYWPWFIDGDKYSDVSTVARRDEPLAHSFASHSAGMVGFIKSLIDYVGESDVRSSEDAPFERMSRILTMEVSPGTVILEKR